MRGWWLASLALAMTLIVACGGPGPAAEPAPGSEAAQTQPAVSDPQPADPEPPRDEPAGQADDSEPGEPLEWRLDAIPLTVTHDPLDVSQRLLATVGCTHCDAGTGALVWWQAEDISRPGPVLFPDVSRGSVYAANEGETLALLACTGTCDVSETGQANPRALYRSEDGGLTWEEFPLPEGWWVFDHLNDDGSMFVSRLEVDGARVRVAARAGYPGGDPLDVDRPPDTATLSSQPDAEGRPWTWSRWAGPETPDLGIVHAAGEEIVNLAPLAIQDVTIDPSGQRAAVAVACSGLAACPQSPYTAYLLIVDLEGRLEVTYVADLEGLIGEPEENVARDLPGFTAMRWLDPNLLLLQTQFYSPAWTLRPALVDLTARTLRAFSEPEALFGDVWPAALIQLPEPVPAHAATSSSCLNVRAGPRLLSREAPLACLNNGSTLNLLGVSVRRDDGTEWLFAEGAVGNTRVIGWVLAAAVGEGADAPLPPALTDPVEEEAAALEVEPRAEQAAEPAAEDAAVQETPAEGEEPAE